MAKYPFSFVLGRMKLATLGYVIAGVVLCTVVYTFYRNRPETVQASNVYLQASTVNSQENTGRLAFSAERKYVVHQQDFQPMVIPSSRNESFDYKEAMQKLNDAQVRQDDPRLIKLIRDYYIEPPSLEPYNLENPDRLEYSNGQTPFIDSRLNYMVSDFQHIDYTDLYLGIL